MQTRREICATSTWLVISLVTFLLLTTPVTALSQGQFHIQDATINDIQNAIKSGQITCQALVQAYINRARAYNGICTALVTNGWASVWSSSQLST